MTDDGCVAFQRDPDEVTHTITEATTYEDFPTILRDCGYFWTLQD